MKAQHLLWDLGLDSGWLTQPVCQENYISTRAEVHSFWMQIVAAGFIIAGRVDDAIPLVGWSRNLEFDQGSGDSSPTLHKGHRGIFGNPPINAGIWDTRLMSI